jgi:hypothetical protein
MEPSSDYDPRYLAGILFFNAHDYFEAHEVWEDLWAGSAQPERRFYQALIQAAVALFHFGNGNVRGAARLYRSSFEYMRPSAPRFLGLDVEDFWRQMAACFGPVATAAQPPADARPEAAALPTIQLNPPPVSWPNAEVFLPEDKESKRP